MPVPESGDPNIPLNINTYQPAITIGRTLLDNGSIISGISLGYIPKAESKEITVINKLELTLNPYPPSELVQLNKQTLATRIFCTDRFRMQSINLLYGISQIHTIPGHPDQTRQIYGVILSIDIQDDNKRIYILLEEKQTPYF